MNKQVYPRRLHKHLPYKAGRDARGRISVRHKGGRHKRRFRVIDFMRNKRNIPARVVQVSYDPNRGSDIALLVYKDGEKRYILAPEGLQEGAIVEAGENVSLSLGNALPISQIPIGTLVHNIELTPGSGGKFARSAGNYASVMGKEKEYIRLKLPSGEIRMVRKECYATIGQLSNQDHKHRKLGKAGKKRYLGIRPSVRGVAQDPSSHPHGGGEGRSGIGMPSPKSPWGKKTLGWKTRRKARPSDKFIVKRRRK